MERAKPSSMQSPDRGECSTFVETSLGASHDMGFPAVSVSGEDASTRRKEANQTAKQYDTASEKPELEAYWKGSWWEVEILKMNLDKCYVHYKDFPSNDDQWVPIVHLRMRSRASEPSDCPWMAPGIDVCVMVRHPHSDTEYTAWYDAQIIDIERKPHTPETCKCRFRIALYSIPDVILQFDISQRKLLPVESDAVALTEMSIMTEARNMSFHEILAASLSSVTNSPRIWAKNGWCWYCTLYHISTSQEKSFSFENRGAGDNLGLSFSQGHREEPGSPQLLLSNAFLAHFLEEEKSTKQSCESPDVRIEEDEDIFVISDSEVHPTGLDVDVESDATCESIQMNDRDIMYLDRFASDNSDVREINPERVEDFRGNPNSASNSESLGNSDEDLAEMIVSDLHSLKPAERSPSKTTSVTPGGKGKILDEIASTGLEEYADELEGMLLDASVDMTERKLVALKTQVVKEKRSKKTAGEITAVRRPVEKDITYSDLFESVKPVQPNIPSQEKCSSEHFSWVPHIIPLFEFPGAVPHEVEVDPLADVWEAMHEALRVAQESKKKVNEGTKEIVHEGTNFVGICEHPDGFVHSEHGTLKFDQEVGEVCEVCGIIVTDIKDMWARDNAKRIAGKKEGNDGSDVDMYDFDEDTFASWNPDDENHKQQKNIERDSNFELIPDLAKHMQRHQKQGFQFLWRNLDGQGSNGNLCFEKGGCVLSHAPGTGKTFLIISFLHSYMKKYPEARPIILAPKIMLQPWMKEFTKWNVDITVHNFNQSAERGRALLQKHEDTGSIRLNHIGRSQKEKLLLYREAMIYQ